MLKNEMESYVRIGEEGFKKSYVRLHGGGVAKIAKIMFTLLMNGPLLLFLLDGSSSEMNVPTTAGRSVRFRTRPSAEQKMDGKISTTLGKIFTKHPTHF